MQTKVSDILSAIDARPITVEPDATVFEAIGAMVRNNVGALLVARGSEICGILTERDYLRGVALKGRRSKEMRVSEIMSSKVVVVPPDRRVGECMAIMTRHGFRHLPVIDGEEFIGMISMRHLTARICDNQAAEIEHLTRYITGDYPG